MTAPEETGGRPSTPGVPTESSSAVVHQLARSGLARLEAEMAQAGPCLAEEVGRWLHRTASGDALLERWLGSRSYPLLHLPYWFATTLGIETDLEFQADVVYSSINGYCAIRLIDNVMDGDGTVETKLLPAVAFFHSRFQGVYHRHFPSDHPFWSDFQAAWDDSAEVTLRDGLQHRVTAEDFSQVAGRKFTAARVPLAAVAHRAGGLQHLGVWAAFAEALGAWYQMANDFFDWHHDGRHRIPTFFVSAAEGRRQASESAVQWFAREGFDWGEQLLLTRLADLRVQARRLGCAAVDHCLDERTTLFGQRVSEARKGIAGLRTLIGVLA